MNIPRISRKTIPDPTKDSQVFKYLLFSIIQYIIIKSPAERVPNPLGEVVFNFSQ